MSVVKPLFFLFFFFWGGGGGLARLCMAIDIVMMTSNGQTSNFHVMVAIGIFLLDNLYFSTLGTHYAGEEHVGHLWRHPARNKQKQCMLGYW